MSNTPRTDAIALKDPVDCLRYCLKDDFGYLDAGQLRGRRGTFY